ncbi:MAG: DUF294 nucleotidyltransferase-like domain-containing protein [Alphaproteobacteria bacterium]|nr:DUF294 nucleotidyltransferase-like domain-containing protein [Alphaproteobacteria bacterium]
MPWTAVFRELVCRHMAPAPIVVAGGDRCGDVVARMVEAETTAAAVTGPDGRICGILTEHDVVRRLTFRTAAETPVADVMSRPVMTVAADDFLYHAIARMRRFKLHHFPVVDGSGKPVGMLHLDQALAAASERLLGQIDRLTQEGTLHGIREVKSAQIDLADELFADNVPAPEIQGLLTHINRDIHRRILENHCTAMTGERWGPAPAAFSFIIMGSGGRGESFLYPDQDNGIILDDYPDAAHGTIDPWFIELGARVTRDLDAVGFPLCKGHVMATNPLWRKTATQWRAQLSGWLRRRSTVALRLADIFFDFRACYGAPDLAADLRAYVTDALKSSPAFLEALYLDGEEYGVALGWFGRFVTEKTNPDHLGKINLKHTGTLPLVQATRLLALRTGLPEISTTLRLGKLHESGVINSDVHDHLTAAFGHLTGLLLRQQIADYKAGKPVSNYVHPDTLRERERDVLVDSFRAIEALRERLKSDFTGDVF